MSNGDQKPVDLSSRISPIWTFVLCALVIAGSLVPALMVLFGSSGTNMLQARIAIILVYFSIACVIGLLFATTAQTTVKGTVGLISLMVVGPGAFFLACLIIYNYMFPESVIQGSDPLTLKRYGELVRDGERHNEWVPLSDWTQRIGALHKLYMRDEERNLEQFLGEVYYHGDDNRKLKDPKLQAIFVYGLPQADGTIPTLGIRRVSGSRVSNVPLVYFGAESSTSEGVTRALLLIRHANNAVEVKDSRDGNWVQVDDDPVDCLTLAFFPDERTPEGDMLSVDTIKHFRNGVDSASVQLAILSRQARTQQHLWEMMGEMAPAQDAVPLVFRQYQSTPRTDLAEMAKQDDLKWWLEYLDKRAALPDSDTSSDGKLAKEVDKMLKSIAPDLKFSNCLTHTALTDKTLYEAAGVKNVVMATFLWGVPLPVTSATRPQTNPSAQ